MASAVHPQKTSIDSDWLIIDSPNQDAPLIDLPNQDAPLDQAILKKAFLQVETENPILAQCKEIFKLDAFQVVSKKDETIQLKAKDIRLIALNDGDQGVIFRIFQNKGPWTFRLDQESCGIGRYIASNDYEKRLKWAD